MYMYILDCFHLYCSPLTPMYTPTQWKNCVNGIEQLKQKEKKVGTK